MSATRNLIGRRQFVVRASAIGLTLAALPATVAASSARASEVAQAYTPGTYTGVGAGRKGPIEVEVTFSEHAIEDIVVLESHETPRIAASAYDQIPACVIEYQSLGVDSVTGATLTSVGLMGAIEDAVKQAGGDVEALEDVPAQKKSDAREELDCDVLVVGSGSSGMVCAMECAMKGAKVCVMEKSSNIGGNALVCGGVLGWANSPLEVRPDMTEGYASYLKQTLQTAREQYGAPQEAIDEVLAQLDEWEAEGNTKLFDSFEWEYLYGLVAGGAGSYSEEGKAYTEAFFSSLEDLFTWFEQTEVEWVTPLYAVAGYPWPTCTKPVEGECGAGYFTAFEDCISDMSLPVDFVMATPASELVMDNGRVVGAKGTCADGTEYTVRASKAVVLATGGFSGNPDMLKKYGAEWGFSDMDYIPHDNAYGHTGDGLTLAMQAGAPEPADESIYVMILPFANAVDLSVESIVGDSGNALLVNKNAERFVDEAQGRNYITGYEMQQPDEMCYLISDATTCGFTDGLNMFGIEEDMLKLQGKCFEANTIEELAEQIGLDPEKLAQTVESFNGYAEAGEDPDFGRTMFTEASVVKNPPFYACPCHWAVHITGALMNVGFSGEALDAQGAPIEGLYAIGELAGDAGITNMATAVMVADAITA